MMAARKSKRILLEKMIFAYDFETGFILVTKPMLAIDYHVPV
jgi:hypothetical protein